MIYLLRKLVNKMNDIITVMKFTIKDMIKRKSFIISTIIILVLIVVGFNVPNVMKLFSGEDNLTKILIVDNNNIFEDKLEILKESDVGYQIDISKDSYDDIKKKLENKEIDGAIEIEKNGNDINMRYMVLSVGLMSEVPENLINSLESLYIDTQINKLDLTERELQSIKPNFSYSMEQTSEEEASGNIIVMMLMSVVLFYAIYFCAYQVSSSITTEKTSKIIETLVTSTSPKNIVLGKTLGIGIVGLVQLILIVATAVISALVFLERGLLEAVLDMSHITLYLGLITIIYFILGYFTYALLYALTGSTVSKPEDIQSANSPIALLAVVGFYLSYFTMINPTSKLNLFASLFPISAPFCMPFRIMMGLASGIDVLISIVILVITILIIAKIAIKIYSNAILNYGTKLSFKDIISMYKDK